MGFMLRRFSGMQGTISGQNVKMVEGEPFALLNPTQFLAVLRTMNKLLEKCQKSKLRNDKWTNGWIDQLADWPIDRPTDAGLIESLSP